MEIKINLRTLIKAKNKSIKAYANAIGTTEQTLRIKFQNPNKFTIEECNKSDMFLELPWGTTHAVINGNVMFNDIIEYING